MRLGFVFGVVGIAATLASGAAMAEDTHNDFSVGYELDRLQNDFGVGINATSPFFANGHMAVQAAIIRAWYDGVNTDNPPTHSWMPYTAAKLGFVGAHPLTANIRTYGVGGLALVMPNSDMSDKGNNLGGYGAFGFEFLFHHPMSYFIEMGGIGTGATADKIATKPIYANGFLETVGFRYYF